LNKLSLAQAITSFEAHCYKYSMFTLNYSWHKNIDCFLKILGARIITSMDSSQPETSTPPVQNPESPQQPLQPSFQTLPQQPAQPTTQQSPPQPFQPAQPTVQQEQQPATSSAMPSKSTVSKVEQIIVLSYFFVAALLLFRFVLSMFGANDSPFVEFVRQLTSPFMIPFTDMFGGPIGVSEYLLEFEVLVAIIVYALVFFGLARLIKIVFK
jgi:uncharacterized protein YggT (Ycf19 family)